MRRAFALVLIEQVDVPGLGLELEAPQAQPRPPHVVRVLPPLQRVARAAERVAFFFKLRVSQPYEMATPASASVRCICRTVQ